MAVRTLSIETSCDETSVAMVEGNRILSNVIYSQIDKHAEYGGVVPSIARLEHEKKIDEVVHQSLNEADAKVDEIDTVSVTLGPGLAIALEVGIRKAKQIALEHNKPLVLVNHMEAHLYSGFADSELKPVYPSLGFLISGGHTELVSVKDFRDYELIGESLDDAAGEAFDKAGAILGLEYPGGPKVSKIAKESKLTFDRVKTSKSDLLLFSNGESLPLPMMRGQGLDMSFSGLKTAFIRIASNNDSLRKSIKDISQSLDLEEKRRADLAFMFEQTVIEILYRKLEMAIELHKPKQVWLGGGVISNSLLLNRFVELCERESAELIYPKDFSVRTDNAGMIGVIANMKFEKDPEGDDVYYTAEDINKIDRRPRWKMYS